MSEPTYLSITRTAYDTVAVDYAELLSDELAAKPLDRAMLGTFAELVRADGGGPVGDLGCGPGRVTAHLDSLGLEAFGVDLSPGMVEEARRRHPGLRFEEGAMAALDLADGSLGGVVAWYSIIHTPPELLPAVFAEFHRVLAPGGHLLLAFQVGDEVRHIEEAYGHAGLSYYAYRLRPDQVSDLLDRAGIAVDARLVREPKGPEKTPQAFLLARKPEGA
ncbi:methyltransferase domain-containing protein [Streptomyces sp. NBC_01537]|uniref:class I SAM-dependent methyltransferase n=1 Tax=Streptomyces sp. NBC_01537 TaxID=2903896 RepID=UPI00386D2066